MRITVELSRPVMRRPVAIIIAIIMLAVPAIVLASHQFSDVPASNPFHADIDALVDSGVTAGCGGGKYCPKAEVTREQMAAFLNRLGALAPGKTPVVNAATVDGIDSSAFLPDGTPPAGTTIRGTYALGSDGEFGWDSISFGVELPTAPTVHFLPDGSAATANCPGTPSEPEAAAGHLCVYERNAGSATDQDVFNPATGTPSGATRWGAGVIGYNTGTTAFWSYGAWALTVGGSVSVTESPTTAEPTVP